MMVKKSINALIRLYKKIFPKYHPATAPKEIHVSAPGRINIIGEHTDYNLGHILPGAIDKKTYVAGAISKDDYIYLYSGNIDRLEKIDPEHIAKEEGKVKWTDYVKGVIKEFQNKGYMVKPFMVGIYGDVPLGVGVSSSASFEVAIAKFITELSRLNINDQELIEITRNAENNFVGVRCGIMDQLSSVMGKENHVIHVDCRDLSTEYIPFPADKVSLVLIDSLQSHTLSDSGYNTRREECDQLLDIVKEHYPDTETFRDITSTKLENLKADLPENLYKRGKHYIEENDRVIHSIQALKESDLETLGNLMFQSHQSLSKNYEVSTLELDRLVELAGRQADICYGARLMGAGFGGATINLVKAGKEQNFIEKVANIYYQEINMKDRANVIICKIGNGAKLEK
jgi:galactokinase